MDTVTTLFLSTGLRGWLDGGFGGRGDWHMMDWGRGFFFPGGFFVLLTGLALLLLLVWAVRSWTNRPTPATVGAGGGVSGYSAQPTPPGGMPRAGTPPVNTPLHALQMRYAKGELSRAEYETIRQDLLADTPTGASPAAAPATQPEGVETPVASNETAAADTTNPVSAEPTAAESTSEQEKRTDV